MSERLFVSSFPQPPVDEREILRYAGVAAASGAELRLLSLCLSELLPKLSYRAVWRILPLAGEVTPLLRAVLATDLGARLLRGCTHAAVLAATVGMAPDRLCSHYGVSAPSRALFIQAAGTERIEALCDALCDRLASDEPGGALTRRVSPGYGDLPLSLQRDIFALLEPARHIGLCLNESLLMSPTKSVTAIVGIRRPKEK